MQLSIIIINYNTFHLTSNCIRSIKEKVVDISYEIILVDNASKECDPTRFLDEFPEIILVPSATNTGFAGGNNLGIEKANGAYLLLLNSDTELINNAPKICLDFMQKQPKVGVTTAQLLYPDGRVQHNCRRFRTITWELLEVIPLYKLLPKAHREALMLHRYFDHARSITCDWVWGAYMLFPKTILDKMKGRKLAEDFFMYSEDVLWCWEIKNQGYDIYFLPEAKVMHINQASTSREKKELIRTTTIKNHAKFMRKYYPDWRWYVFASIYFAKQYSALLLGKLLKG